MAVIPIPSTIRGALFGNLTNPGPPQDGVSQQDTLNLDATSGTFSLKGGGFPTTPITWASNNVTLLASINAAIRALPTVGGTAITATAGTLTNGVGTVLLTMSGSLAVQALPGFFTVANNSLLGNAVCTIGSPSTTPGVDATARGAAKATLLVDTINGVLYQNQGTPPSTAWVKVGLES